MDAVSCQKKLQSLYNNKEYADIKIRIPDEASKDGSTWIYAHKTILASGSMVFRFYFEFCLEDEEDSDPSGIQEVHITDILRHCMFADCYIPMLRFFYGLPLFANDQAIGLVLLSQLYEIADIVKFAELKAYALRELEQKLIGSLAEIEAICVMDDQIKAFDQFAMKLEPLLEYNPTYLRANPGGTTSMVAKVSVKHFAKLDESGTFQELGARHPGLLMEMLRQATRPKSDPTRSTPDSDTI